MVADLYDGLYFMGSGVFIIMLFAYLMRNEGIHFHEINYYQIIKIIKYGLVRIPSFIAQFILLAGIPIYLAQAVSFESVAYFSSSL
jgi:hypothetical protein